MNLYKIEALQQELEAIAEANEGLIPEDKLKELVEAQTKTMYQTEDMLKLVKDMEVFEAMASNEIERIRTKQQRSKNIRERIKKYLIPWVKIQGKIDIGTFTVSTRRSSAVVIDDITRVPAMYLREKTTYEPNKEDIKKLLVKGGAIDGVTLEERESLQIR